MTDDGIPTSPNHNMPDRRGQTAAASPISRLKAFEQHFQAVLETMNLAGLVVDTQGRILLCNNYLLTLTGWQRHEVMGRSWAELFMPPDAQQSHRAIFAAAIAGGQCPTHHTSEILTRSGDRRMIAWNNTCFVDPDGHLQRVTSIGQDITEQRQVDQRLTDSERQLQKAEGKQTEQA
ncbi:MAG: PAS domain S-box protein, partial [Nodosilinea sp.]